MWWLKLRNYSYVVHVEEKVGLYRGSYMSAHVLLNLLNLLGKRDKMRGLPSLINSIIQEHEY